MVSKKLVWGFAFIMIAIEQGLKLVINGYYLNANLPLLPPWLYFNPIFNRDYSWFNSMFQLGVGKWPHIVITAAVLGLICYYYVYLNRRELTKPVIDIMFVFIFAGAACSLIDKVFWNGSLDYIQFIDWFTFDLKDVYLNIFTGLLLLIWCIKRKSLVILLRDGQ